MESNHTPKRLKLKKLKTQNLGHFCPFRLISEYIRECGSYANLQGQFFIFKDKSPLKSSMVRNVLENIVKKPQP